MHEENSRLQKQVAILQRGYDTSKSTSVCVKPNPTLLFIGLDDLNAEKVNESRLSAEAEVLKYMITSDYNKELTKASTILKLRCHTLEKTHEESEKECAVLRMQLVAITAECAALKDKCNTSEVSERVQPSA